jgi:predicted membrane-bound dolichyl-phosphate-mannose-protein mannosyltransferase
LLSCDDLLAGGNKWWRQARDHFNGIIALFIIITRPPIKFASLILHVSSDMSQYFVFPTLSFVISHRPSFIRVITDYLLIAQYAKILFYIPEFLTLKTLLMIAFWILMLLPDCGSFISDI